MNHSPVNNTPAFSSAAAAYPCSAQRRFDHGNRHGQRAVWWVFVLTVATMAVEITAGSLFNSIALLADGWHMSSHALAMGLTLFAYWAARRFAADKRFAFGTWKIEILAGFVSALLLLLVALGMAYESVWRLLQPQTIAFNSALLVAVVGLLVNVASVWLLQGSGNGHHHHHDDGHDHSHGHAHTHGHQHGHDLNMRSAYLHVLADALTSVAAIVALLAGKYFGWNWLDALMGIVGGLLVGRWAVGLLASSGKILLDAEMDGTMAAALADYLRDEGLWAQVHDYHLWRVGKDHYACMLTLETPLSAVQMAQLGTAFPQLHLTVAASGSR